MAQKLSNKRFLLVGHLPPPITGQSEAFQLLIDHLGKTNILNDIIDIGTHGKNRRVGKFQISRFIEIIYKYFYFLYKAFRFEVMGVYLSIGISRIGFFRDFIFIWSAYFRRLKIILQLHGGGYKDFYFTQNRIIQTIIKNTLSKASNIIVLSSGFEEEFHFLPDYKNKICVVHNSANVDERVLLFHKDFQTPTFRILYMSNLIVSKGYLDLLEVGKFIKELNYEIIFCGKYFRSETEEGLNEIDFIQNTRDHNTYGNVKYLGIVSGQQKWDIFKESHVFVLPTYYRYEGQPISIIEALAYGLPIISTDYRGISDMVFDKYNGFLIRVNSPKQIAEKIKLLYNDRHLCAQMGEKSKLIYRKSFSQELNRQAYLKIFSADT